MKRKTNWIKGVFIMAVAAELAGCVGNQATYEEQAVQILNERYAEEFEIDEYMGHDWETDYYEVRAYAKQYPDILFEARVACDGSYISDEYVASRISRKIEEQMEENIKGLPGYFQLKVEAANKSINSADAQMPPEEYVEKKDGVKFAVFLIYAPQEKDAHRVYENLSGICRDMEYISGNMQLYITDSETVADIQKYLEENAKIYTPFEEILTRAHHITVPIVNGNMEMTEKEFMEMAGENI